MKKEIEKRNRTDKNAGGMFCPYINFDSYYDKMHRSTKFVFVIFPHFSFVFPLQFWLMFSTRQSITFDISLNLFYQFVKH